MQDTERTDERRTDGADSAADEDAAATRSLDGAKNLEFADAVEIRTTKDDLWAFISDPESLTECVPGAERIERLSERRYSLDITRGVSHLTISISGDVEFVEMNEPDWIVASGFAHDTKTGTDFDVLAAMEMTETDDGHVRLSYKAEMGFSGGAVSLGKGLLRPIVERDVNTYFENVREGVETELAAESEPAPE